MTRTVCNYWRNMYTLAREANQLHIFYLPCQRGFTLKWKRCSLKVFFFFQQTPFWRFSLYEKTKTNKNKTTTNKQEVIKAVFFATNVGKPAFLVRDMRQFTERTMKTLVRLQSRSKSSINTRCFSDLRVNNITGDAEYSGAPFQQNNEKTTQLFSAINTVIRRKIEPRQIKLYLTLFPSSERPGCISFNFAQDLSWKSLDYKHLLCDSDQTAQMIMLIVMYVRYGVFALLT